MISLATITFYFLIAVWAIGSTIEIFTPLDSSTRRFVWLMSAAIVVPLIIWALRSIYKNGTRL